MLCSYTLTKAIEEANNKSWEFNERFSEKQKAAKQLQKNCLPRPSRSSFYVPFHFKVKVFQGENKLTERSLRKVRNLMNKLKHRQTYINLSKEIPASAADL